MLAEELILTFKEWAASQQTPSANAVYKKVLELIYEGKFQGLRGSEREIDKIIEETFFQHFPYNREIHRITHDIQDLFKADAPLTQEQKSNFISQVTQSYPYLDSTILETIKDFLLSLPEMPAALIPPKNKNAPSLVTKIFKISA